MQPQVPSAKLIVHSGLPSLAMPGELVFVRGAGGTAYDTSETEYIDFVLGYGSVVLGHGDAAFVSRVAKLNEDGIMLPGYSDAHFKLITRLVSPDLGLTSAAFFKTGSESITAAIRLTSYHSGRRGLIRCGFLGWHDAELGNSVRWHESLSSPLRYVVRFTDGFRGVTGAEHVFNWTSLALTDLAQLLEAHSHTIASLLIDTYQLAFCSPATMAKAIEMCHHAGVFVVCDETKIAGRVSPLGMAVSCGWRPDFIVVGKALANGAPLSILLGSAELMCAAETARITGTFSQELNAVYAALTTAERMAEENGYSVLRTLGAQVVATFNAAVAAVGLNDVVRAVPRLDGSMFEVVFSDELLPDWPRRQALTAALALSKVLMLQGHPSYVCLAHRALDFRHLQEQFVYALASWRDSQL